MRGHWRRFLGGRGGCADFGWDWLAWEAGWCGRHVDLGGERA